MIENGKEVEVPQVEIGNLAGLLEVFRKLEYPATIIGKRLPDGGVSFPIGYAARGPVRELAADEFIYRQYLTAEEEIAALAEDRRREHAGLGDEQMKAGANCAGRGRANRWHQESQRRGLVK